MTNQTVSQLKSSVPGNREPMLVLGPARTQRTCPPSNLTSSRQRLATAIAEAREIIFLNGATCWTSATHLQVCSTRRAETRADTIGGAASSATARQGRNITSCFARDVLFDYLPCVFSNSVLPVSAKCRKRQQHPRRKQQRNGGNRCLVEPLLHTDLDSSAACFRCDSDR